MWGVREHIDWLDGCHLIIYVHHLEVASLCGRVATYIDDALRGCVQDDLDDIRVHTGTRWVGDDDVWATMLSDEVVGEDILHIACIEEGIGDVVYLGVDLGILDSLRYVFDTNHLLGLVSHEVGDGSGTGIEVINEFVARKVGKLTCHAVEVVSLLGVSLIETLWSYLETQVLHQLEDMVVALEEAELQVVESIISLLVIDVHQGGNLRELVGYVLHQLLCFQLVAFLIVMELEDEHPLARIAVANHHIAEQSVLFTEVIEGEVVGVGVLEDIIANLVAEVVHQPAFLDRINLVESSRDVETDGILGMTLLQGRDGIVFFLRELSQFL